MNQSEKIAFVLHEILHSLVLIRGNIELDEKQTAMEELDWLAELSRSFLQAEMSPDDQVDVVATIIDVFPAFQWNGSPVLVKTNTVLLKAVLKSYAHNAQVHGLGPVEIVLNITDGVTTIRVTNAINHSANTAACHGIGLKLVSRLCQAQGYECNTKKEGETFVAEIQIG